VVGFGGDYWGIVGFDFLELMMSGSEVCDGCDRSDYDAAQCAQVVG
jgi:hypothetical protein